MSEPARLPVAIVDAEEIAKFAFLRKNAKDILTPERVAVIAANVKDGQALKVCCALAGVGEDMFRQRYRLGAAGDPEWEWMYEMIVEAAAEFEQEAIGAIRVAGKNGTWQAYAWLMERKYPDRYGRRTQTTFTAEEKKTVSFTLHMGDSALDTKDEPDVIEAEVVENE